MVIIEGEVWALADEPTYVIHQRGMGYNHGGTTLSIETGRTESMTNRCFSLLNFDVALEAATQAAIGRGNDRSLLTIKSTRAAKIYVPSAFKFPTRAARKATVHLIEESRKLIDRHGLETVQVV
ncbi:hypothetical protein ACX80Z_15875 [Arthrobacter sp. TMT4-20]